MRDTIWCIFSVENDYNQPENNLFAWFNQRPTLQSFYQMITGTAIEDELETERILKGIKAYKGNLTQIKAGETSYMLTEVNEGILE